MGAAPIIRQVYREHIKYFGEPDESLVYEEASASVERPNRIDVFVWHASADMDITTFSTIGMAATPMPGAKHRAELHFSIRHALDRCSISNFSIFLANLAMYPFLNNTFFDWWHKVRTPGVIPLYSNAMAVLFHPRFVDGGWESIEAEGLLVKILNVVPITMDEYEMRPFSRLFDLWDKIGLDLFEPR
jgi:hypothetical protein